ncbi:MAG: single-stranded DNA-binding protein [Phycisphaerales bacterium]
MNVFCFAGNITKDIELRTTQSGKKVASFSIAINEGKDKTMFLNCVAWDKTGELLAEYCAKGDRLSGSGKIDVRKYNDNDGVTKYVTEVIVNQFDFPPKKSGEKPAQAVDDIADDLPF